WRQHNRGGNPLSKTPETVQTNRASSDITPARINAPHHPYSQLLFSSVPKLDPAWLDGLEQDPELVRAYCRR
ncbi:hypothetical protein GOD36_31055, partial [Sinorhizobium medicae]|nr:hypothetical protein [Sinorhizobium medicae]MDX0827966.1 hypothetical protein [Sinorhizobium medicae]